MPPRVPGQRPLVILPLLIVLAVSSSAQPPPQDSPFLPPATAMATAQPAAGNYDLVGMTVVGKDVLVSINRQSDKHSAWIAVGKTVGKITVVSYDPTTDSAVIRADDRMLNLTMRKGGVVAGPVMAPPNFAAAPVFAGPVPGPPSVSGPVKPMNTQQEKETEARMLVSDLLEIGQRQRQAYAEAQRQAALRAPAPKMPRTDAAPPAKP